MAKTISFTFGRFNPPTIGHEKLMDKTRKANRNYRIYASQSQDSKKNPLDFKTKTTFMKAMFPVHARSISTDKVITPFDILTNLYNEKYTDVVMVVGSDRVEEFEKQLTPYNGKKARHGYFKFNSIKFVSAGERDPDAEGVSGMSASKMRKAAQDNDYDSFAKGLPRKFKQGKMLFKTLQKALGVKSLKEYIEEGRPNQAARSLSDPKFRAKTEKDRKKATKKGYKKHKGRMYEDEKIMTFKQAQEKDKKDQNKDPVGSQHEGILDTLFPKELSAAQKRIYKKEYSAASKLYKQFIKRGDKPGVALHKAASSVKHVTDRGLQQFLKR
jgi:phosphopantetheine adenylyltransferase